MTTTRAYEEIIDFIAAGTSPDGVVAFHPSEETKARVADLSSARKPAACRPMKPLS